MKKLLVGLFAIFICTIAIAHTVEWYVGNSLYQTTTCNSGDNITPPSAPAKYGYTFDRWEEQPYAKLEYIESTGTQYLNIGNLFVTSINKIEAGIVPISTAGGRYVFGAMNVSPYVGLVNSLTGYLAVVNNTLLQSTQTSYLYEFYNSYNIEIYNSSTTSYVDINGSRTVLENRGIPRSDMVLFGIIYNDRFEGESARIKYFKEYDNNNLVFDGVPVRRRADNVIGMYDYVTNTFFTNQGTGEFIAGPEIGDL